MREGGGGGGEVRNLQNDGVQEAQHHNLSACCFQLSGHHKHNVACRVILATGFCPGHHHSAKRGAGSMPAGADCMHARV